MTEGNVTTCWKSESGRGVREGREGVGYREGKRWCDWEREGKREGHKKRDRRRNRDGGDSG